MTRQEKPLLRMFDETTPKNKTPWSVVRLQEQNATRGPDSMKFFAFREPFSDCELSLKVASPKAYWICLPCGLPAAFKGKAQIGDAGMDGSEGRAPWLRVL